MGSVKVEAEIRYDGRVGVVNIELTGAAREVLQRIGYRPGTDVELIQTALYALVDPLRGKNLPVAPGTEEVGRGEVRIMRWSA